MLEILKIVFEENIVFMLYISCFILVIGLVVGSFLNVVGLRLLSEESIVYPPSKCPKCNTRLKWYDNIPVLAWLLLRGKCRYCKAPISVQYPIVELLTGIMFLLIFLTFGFTLNTLMLWILLGACIVMCITDFREQVVFDWVSIPLIPIGLIYSFFNIGAIDSGSVNILGLNLPWTFVSGIIGILISAVLFEGFSLLTKLIIQHRAFGEGDTIIAMAFGAWFGWKAVLITIVLGLIVQTVFTIPLMIKKLFTAKDKVATASFFTLIFAAVLPVILNRFEFFYTGLGSLLLVIITLPLAAGGALIFLRRMRELNSYTLLPFGPALITGGFIVIFYFDYFMNLF